MDFKEISSYSGKKRNRGGHVAIPELVNRGLGFVRREWPLCLFAATALCSIFFCYDDAPRRFAGLIGLAGGALCLKRFGLDRNIWIYLLAAVLAILPGISLDDVKRVRTDWQLHNFDTQLVWLMLASLRGLLVAVPFSLLFMKKAQGVSMLWKVPLCVFFLILALEPLFLGVAIMIILPFASCP